MVPFLNKYSLPSILRIESSSIFRGERLCACSRRVSLNPELRRSDVKSLLKSVLDVSILVELMEVEYFIISDKKISCCDVRWM